MTTIFVISSARIKRKSRLKRLYSKRKLIIIKFFILLKANMGNTCSNTVGQNK
jgi:hypothetical protein